MSTLGQAEIRALTEETLSLFVPPVIRIIFKIIEHFLIVYPAYLFVGAAIATVPEFTNCKSMLMNGTSMASPHVAGALALILSGLKKLKIAYTPYSIKRAIENTALKISYVDEFAQGSGLLCVEKLFDHLVMYKDQPENQIKFSVTVGNSSKGIHIRSGHLTKPHEYNVTVEPLFFNEKFVESSEKVKFNIRLTLVASESWISCGTFIDMCYCSRTFTIKIDPTGLPSGVHTAKVLAFDSNFVQKGVVFQIPITVVQPNVVNNPKFEFVSEPILFKPNTIIRDFILVPNNATYAVLEMISADPNDNNGGRFLIHTMQILPDLYCKALETQKILPVGSENFTYHPFKVKVKFDFKLVGYKNNLQILLSHRQTTSLRCALQNIGQILGTFR